MLLVVTLQQWLLNSPEYQTVVEELKQMPKAGRLVQAIKQVNFQTSAIAYTTTQAFYKAYRAE